MALRDFADRPDIDALLGQDGLHIGARFGMNCEKQTAVRLRIAQQQAFMASLRLQEPDAPLIGLQVVFTQQWNSAFAYSVKNAGQQRDFAGVQAQRDPAARCDFGHVSQQTESSDVSHGRHSPQRPQAGAHTVGLPQYR